MALYCTAWAQTPLQHSLHTSAQQYIYRITDAEAQYIVSKGIKPDKAEAYLHTLVDSTPINGTLPRLEAGHYLLAHAQENSLLLSLHPVANNQVKIINNYRSLAVLVHDSVGNILPNAKVTLRNKHLAFDAATQTYRLNRFRKKGLLKVQYNSAVSFYPLANSLKKNLTLWQKIKWSFPLKYISNWLRPKRKYRSRHNYFSGTVPYQNNFYSYFVYSKPRYKPGDTLHFKAYVVPKEGKMVNRPLLLRLSNRNLDIDTILATVQPYRPGGYEGELVLNDSLDLDLDDDYLLTLEELSSRRYDLDEYDGDLDDEEYVLKRKVLAKGNFTFEEYELDQVKFTARADKTAHGPGNHVAIFAKASDENDLPIADGRLQITLLRNNVSAVYVPQLYIPDTLWQHNQALDPVGETKIALPDSIFPKADFGYTMVVRFLNSNNEEQVKQLLQQYHFSSHRLVFKPKQDSLQISYQHNGQDQPQRATITLQSGRSNTMQQVSATLPITLPISPFMESCMVQTDSAQENYVVQRSTAAINFYTNRTQDSVTIQTNNPNQLFFWYTFMAGNRVLQKGYTNNLNIAQKTISPKNYFLLLQYIWAGKVQTQDYFIPYHNKTLSIEVEQPATVYPGQQSQINLLVKDAAGKPVADADVTGWSFTQKFENAHTPTMPFTSKAYGGFTKKVNYRLQGPQALSADIQLNWQRWSKEMALDSIAYFQFLHPTPIYQSTVPMVDSITQLAPFVVKNGDLQPIHLLYIDERPVFFSQAEQMQRYSFAVKPGKHALRMRTHNSMIQLDSIWVQAGVKNIISIQSGGSAKGLSTTAQPDSLTLYEQQLWGKYMIVVQNRYGEDFATIAQNNILYQLPPFSPYNYNNYSYNSPYDRLVGPLPTNYAQLKVKRQFEQDFTPEPQYSFTIEKGLIKQKSLSGRNPFRSHLSNQKPMLDFGQRVLTEEQVDSLWQDYLDTRAQTTDIHSKRNGGSSNLEIAVNKQPDGQTLFVKTIFLFRYDNPDVMQVYKGQQRLLGSLPSGYYRMMLLLKAGQYALYDSILVKDNGYNYFATGIVYPKAKDSMSQRMNDIVDSWRKENYYQNFYADDDRIKETFNVQYFNTQSFTNTINGRIIDENGTPIAFAVVKVKGLAMGAIADANGFFAIRVPQSGTLEFSAVGYQTVHRTIGTNMATVMMPQAKGQLSEVVVTASAVRSVKAMGFSMVTVAGDNIQQLQGKVAGVQISNGLGLLGKNTKITIRGVSSISELKSPLYVVDGVPYSGAFADLDANSIVSVDVQKDGSALYGAAGANGVIVVTTNKGTRMLLDSLAATTTETAAALPNTLRRHFKDDGFWQPRLRTDAQGKASFSVTFPDDITKWRTFYAAMTDKRQTGLTELAIRSYKPLSANLALPQFLVQGDSIHLIGKVLNYNSDTATANRQFFINDTLIKQAAVSVANARIDTFALRIAAADSIKLKYTIEQIGGYFDGEERTVPVFVQGITETQGLFAVLDTDTSFTLPTFNKTAPITVHAEASVLPVMLDEIDKVKKYEYLCNEQLASKLKCLLLEKKIRQQMGQPFKEEKQVKTIIDKLLQNRGRNFMWGWWTENDPAMWISLHVTEALLQAEAMGYTFTLVKQPIIDYLVYNQASFYREDKVRSLLLLQQLQAKADFKAYADSIAKYIKPTTLYQKLQWIKAQQQLGLPVNTDSVLLWSSRTMLGNLYWGEEGYRFFDNAVQNTLLAYAILRKKGGQEALLKKMRYYFLEKRKNGQWRNTYESALILETILPDLLAEAGANQAPAFTIGGSQNITVKDFPFTWQANAADNITVSKKAGLPLYFTAYQQYHNPAPQKVNTDFEVSTVFEKNGQPLQQLKAGEAVQLTTTVTVKADADYVMVEIPIPAGCSYKSKQQAYANNEVHREHFKNKVSLFCTSLTKGSYTFTIELLPRYNGLYQLNPAKAEMMYFPVFYGREGMKQVAIK